MSIWVHSGTTVIEIKKNMSRRFGGGADVREQLDAKRFWCSILLSCSYIQFAITLFIYIGLFCIKSSYVCN